MRFVVSGFLGYSILRWVEVVWNACQIKVMVFNERESKTEANVGIIRSKVGRLSDELKSHFPNIAVTLGLEMKIKHGTLTRQAGHTRCKLKVKNCDERWEVKVNRHHCLK